MKKLIIVLLLTIGFLPYTHAQKHTYNWVFGYNAGLTWNTTRSLSATGLFGTPSTTLTGLPTSLSNVQVNTYEGTFVVSDTDGNLMFYSDGMKIWDRNNTLMTNGTGLTGSMSSTQSGIILVHPGNPNQYLAITIGEQTANNLAYSVVDMTLRSGFGDVVSGQKNIALTGHPGRTGESVTTTRHANGKDYWIVAKSLNGTTDFSMNAWLVTSAGVPTPSTPVTSTFPYPVKNGGNAGYLKISPDRKHFLWPNHSDNRFFYGDFDNATGQFSNINVMTGLFQAYGSEFSPDSKLVYITTPNGLNVYKADELFTFSNPALVTRKVYTLPVADVETGALQYAPDGRIYWAMYYVDGSLRVIDNPNDFDNLRVYVTSSSLFTGKSQMGLPSFERSYFDITPTAKPFRCAGNTGTYNVSVTSTGVAGQPVRIEWNFGDGSPIVNQPVGVGTATYTQTHNYATGGQYTITITPYSSTNVALTTSTLNANVVECVLQSNRNIRTNLFNIDQQ